MGWLERLKLPPVPALGRLSPDKVGREAEDYLRRIKDALGAFSLEGLVVGAEEDNITFPATPHTLLSATHTDTTPGSPDAGSLLKGDGSRWEEFAIGAADRVLLSNASDASWTQVPTGAIADAAVTYAKIQDVSAAARLLGRAAGAGSGDVQELDGTQVTDMLAPYAWRDVAAFAVGTTGADDDDEFRDGSIDAAWTQIDPGAQASVWTEAGDVLSTKLTGNDPFFRLHAMTKPLPSLAIGSSVQSAMRFFTVAASFPIVGIMLTDGSNVHGGANAQVVAYVSIDNATNPWYANVTLARWTGFDTRGTALTLADVLWKGPYMHLRLNYVAANSFSVDVSPDGVSWITAIAAQAHTLTPTDGGVVASTNGAVSAYIGTFEHFRIT